MWDDYHGTTSLAVGFITIVAIIILGIMLYKTSIGIMNTYQQNLEDMVNELDEQETEQQSDIVGIMFDNENETANIIKNPSTENSVTVNKADTVISANNNSITGDMILSQNNTYEAPKSETAGMWVAICFGIVAIVVVILVVLKYKFKQDQENREHTEYMLNQNIKTIASEEVDALKDKYK